MQIYQEYTSVEPLFEASIHGLAIAFFVQAGRLRLKQTDSFSSLKKHKQQSYIDTFFNLCTYMNEHCTEDLSMDELAEMTGFSKSHFIRLFKEFAGVSYYEYLTKRRLLHAELLTLPCRAALTVWQLLTESLSPVTTVRQLITAKDSTAPPDHQETPFYCLYMFI